jgi:prepilin-type processing-associated H-X9-DG protein
VAPDPSIHFRHDRRANVAWTDGHVRARALDFSGPRHAYGAVDADTMAAWGFGWFGPRSAELFDLE